jgi:hypothetical protein
MTDNARREINKVHTNRKYSPRASAQHIGVIAERQIERRFLTVSKLFFHCLDHEILPEITNKKQEKTKSRKKQDSKGAVRLESGRMVDSHRRGDHRPPTTYGPSAQ